MRPDKPRWVYRFDNYGRAFALLREAIEGMAARPFSQLEKEGIVQRFEYTWELAWKLLKDCLDDGGVVLDSVTPKTVIRAAFAASLISDGETWMRALDARNLMSHTYDIETFNRIVEAIRDDYLGIFAALDAGMNRKLHG